MENREKLLSLSKKDFIVQTFRAGGKGGQKQNKTSSGVRILHQESGSVGESREERSQHQNKKIAFNRLVNSKSFQKWLRIEVSRSCGRLAEIESLVDSEINSNNVKCEVIDENGRWVTWEEIPDE